MPGKTVRTGQLYKNLMLTGAGRSAIALGFWAALLLMVLQLYNCGYDLYGFFFLQAPAMSITDAASYAEYYRTTAGAFMVANQAINAFIPVLYVVLAVSVHYYAAEDKKAFTLVGILAAAAFMTVASSSCFVNATTTHWAFIYNDPQMLPWAYSTMIALNTLELLTWGFFLGVSHLFTAPAFSGGDWVQETIFWMLLFMGGCRLVWAFLGVFGLFPDLSFIIDFVIVYGALAVIGLLIYFFWRLYRRPVPGGL